MSSIAINLADTTRLPTMIGQMLLGPVIGSRHIVEVESGQLDGSAVVLDCDEQRGRAILDIMRFKDRADKRYPTRGYVQGPRGGWSKIPA